MAFFARLLTWRKLFPNPQTRNWHSWLGLGTSTAGQAKLAPAPTPVLSSAAAVPDGDDASPLLASLPVTP